MSQNQHGYGNLFQVFKTRSVKKVDRMQTLL